MHTLSEDERDNSMNWFYSDVVMKTAGVVCAFQWYMYFVGIYIAVMFIVYSTRDKYYQLQANNTKPNWTYKIDVFIFTKIIK